VIRASLAAAFGVGLVLVACQAAGPTATEPTAGFAPTTSVPTASAAPLSVEGYARSATSLTLYAEAGNRSSAVAGSLVSGTIVWLDEQMTVRGETWYRVRHGAIDGWVPFDESGLDSVGPGPGERLVGVAVFGDVGIVWADHILLTDGRLLSSSPEGTLVERWLTTVGSQAVLDELGASGFFEGGDQDLRSPAVRDFGTTTYVIILEGTTVGTDNFRPTPDGARFMELVERMRDLTTWLPPDGWVAGSARSVPFVPHAFWVVTTWSPGVLSSYPAPPTFSADVDEVAWPLPVPVREFGTPLSVEMAGTDYRCGVVALDEAEVLLEMMRRLGAPVPSLSTVWGTQLELSWLAADGIARVTVSPMLPYDADCSTLRSY